MADSKITALTAISTVDPTADPLVIVDVSDTSMAASGTTKKSTINQLLGAGGTATLASATITGDLTVDTSTLKVDSANNRVGIGTASPALPLEIYKASGDSKMRITSGANSLTIGWDDPNGFYYTANTSLMAWQLSGSTAMTLNSSGLFLGISSQAFAEKFRVYGSYTLMDDGAFTGFLGKASSLGVSGATTDFGIRSSNALIFLSGGATERMRIDATGNVGIGVTPGYRFHVKSDLSELYFRDNGTASELLINSETGGRSALYFGDVADIVRGGIVYESATDSLEIRGYNNAARLQIDSVGNVVSNVTGTVPTLATNSQMVFNLTSNTNLRISVRGTDGVTRTANITLA